MLRHRFKVIENSEPVRTTAPVDPEGNKVVYINFVAPGTKLPEDVITVENLECAGWTVVVMSKGALKVDVDFYNSGEDFGHGDGLESRPKLRHLKDAFKAADVVARVSQKFKNPNRGETFLQLAARTLENRPLMT